MTQFVIGTAQFGMNYGIANSTGQPSEKTIREIIDCATTNEILYYDTAISYGSSEEVLGKIFGELGIHQQVKVFTKVPKRTKTSIPRSQSIPIRTTMPIIATAKSIIHRIQNIHAPLHSLLGG